MGGAWHTPVEEIDAHLYALGLPSDARGMRLVDLGFGDGQFLVRAALTGADCYGVDISKVGYDMAVARYMAFADSGLKPTDVGRLLLICAPMEATDHPDDSFDFAISMGSMEHALDIPAAIREMARILKPEGRWLIYVPNEQWQHFDQPLETTAPSSWWIEQLEAAGLVVAADELMGDNNRISGIKPRNSGAAI